MRGRRSCTENAEEASTRTLAAQCELQTGRSLDIAPPGWQWTFDPLRDGFNHEHGAVTGRADMVSGLEGCGAQCAAPRQELHYRPRSGRGKAVAPEGRAA